MSKADNSEGTEQTSSSVSYRTTWGPRLFWGVLIGALIFFWWLLIYSGGVVVQH